MRGETLNDETKKELLKLHARIAVAEGAGDDEARVLEQIVAMDPLDGEALILLGQHYGRSNDPEKAIFYYERAESIDKYEADAKVRHAQLLVQLSRYSEAIPLLKSATVESARQCAAISRSARARAEKQVTDARARTQIVRCRDDACQRHWAGAVECINVN